MAKQRTLNEIRQSKEYQIAKETVNIQPKNPFEHEEVDKACLLYTSPSPRD